MKIGIITQPLTSNYGGILQNYALQTVLKRMGHEPYTFDVGKFTWFDWCLDSIKVVIHMILGHKGYKFSLNPKDKKQIEIPLRRFVTSNISLVSPKTKRVIKKTVERYHFDALVVGSDQVWRPAYNRFLSDSFFGFLDDKSKAKRISYAASFGTDYWEYSNTQTKECSDLIKKFDAISVREDSGVGLCNKYFNVRATHVLDPTLLLSSKDYEKLCVNIPVKDAFLFAYILDQNSKKLSEIESFSQRLNLPYIIMSAGPEIKCDESIELWLSYFRDAAYVITDSFHGTVFSIIFQKNFHVYNNANRGNSRIESLLCDFELTNHIVTNSDISLQTIDWPKMSQLLIKMRSNSQDWLRNNLINIVYNENND